jgi:acetyl esterase/lipase
MDRGTKFLLTSSLRALHAANARKPLAETGPASLLAFMNGLPGSELPRQHMALHGASTMWALARGAHRSAAGKLGLVLTAGSMAALWQVHQRSTDAEHIVERALRDQLGDDYRSRMAECPVEATTTKLPILPTRRVRRRYVEGGHIVYGDAGKRTTLDVWKRPDLPADAKAPVLVQVHGGAWIYGDKEGQAYPLLSHLAERGWVCVSVTYRLSPRATWPDHIIDVKRALAWVKEHIADHGGDPDWVAITGGSAGGHLSSLAALTPNDPQFQPGFEDADTSVRAAVPFYGVYDWTNRDGTGRADIAEMLAERVVKRPLEEARDVYENASPMTHVGPDAPPMMLLHGTADSLVPVAQARSMVDLLRASSRQPVVYVEYPGAQHAFDVFAGNRTNAAVDGIERFLNVVRAETGQHVREADAPSSVGAASPNGSAHRSSTT